jgi:DnaJ family protein A protein 2
MLEKLQEILPKPGKPISAEQVDEVEYDPKANIEDFGAKDGQAWEDEDEDDEPAQCATQ